MARARDVRALGAAKVSLRSIDPWTVGPWTTMIVIAAKSYVISHVVGAVRQASFSDIAEG